MRIIAKKVKIFYINRRTSFSLNVSKNISNTVYFSKDDVKALLDIKNI